jgi:hypothetical protein
MGALTAQGLDHPVAGRVHRVTASWCPPDTGFASNAQTRSSPAHAALLNGGKLTFPHRLCFNNVTDGSIVVDRYSVVGQQLSFTIRGTGAAPLHAACTQDLFRISINSCEWPCPRSCMHACWG